ncbi:hypothetical protein LguiB_006827 [Lonicera macranthoides]
MADNPIQGHQNEPMKEPPSSTSPSRKRLLSDLNKPKQISSNSLTEFSISKKTRDSPNLSNCHGCGVRINYSNPKERLQTLDSVWRIVLLCKKCFKRVESSEVCSYCFNGMCEGGSFRCSGCKRCVHKDCVVKFGRIPPWSYCRTSESRFRVCIDCWVPKLLVKSTRVYSRRRRKSIHSVDDSRVSVNSNSPKLAQDAVKDAKVVLEKKVLVGARAKENVLRKAVVAKSAVESSNDAVQLVDKKDSSDAELAFRLHRAMNSSPRISRNVCVLNSSGLAVPNSGVFKCNVPCRSAECRESLVANDKLNGKIKRTVSEPSVCLRVSDLSSSIGLGSLIRGEVTDNRESVTGKPKQDNGQSGLAEVFFGECHSVDHKRMNFESDSCQNQYVGNQELHSNESRTQGLDKCTGNSNVLHYRGCSGKPDRFFFKYRTRIARNRTILQNGRCNGKSDRYLLKYKRRPIKSRAGSNVEIKVYHDSLHLEENVLLKYKKRTAKSKAECNTETKLYDDSLHLENKDSAQNCAGNSNMLDDGRCNGNPDRYLLKYSKRPINSKQFQPCAVHAQAFAGGSS